MPPPFFPADGRGLNPLLRHPGMIIHPPMLYLGFVSFVIPYAFAMAALITGRSDDRWIRLTRRWTLWAWLFLSFGLVLGSRWAYDVLGWGGFWGWDPVEIAAFMPWLTGTAFLHSVMIQEKRGLLKHWNMLLIILTYSLVIFGTFLTRSGVLSSVHAFAQSAIGPAFFAFIGLTLIASIALLIHRWPELRGETEMKSMLSREALFLLNNLLFMSVLVVCFWGVIFPLISELVTGQKVTVGPAVLQSGHRAAVCRADAADGDCAALGLGPFGPADPRPPDLETCIRSAPRDRGPLLYVHPKCPGTGRLLPDRLRPLDHASRSSGARRGPACAHSSETFLTALWTLFGRDPRRYGGYIIHISMMLMAIGILGISFFQTETQATVVGGRFDQPGRLPREVRIHRAVPGTGQPSGHAGRPGRLRCAGHLSGRGASPHRLLCGCRAEHDHPGERSTLKDDLYVLLIDWQPASATGATFKVYVNPW